MRYFTSDTQYGHQNIIRFCDRPYADVDHMNVDLVNRAAEMFEVGDELWHLGDVALGTLDNTLAHLARIPVDVTLVAGNHDRCHPYNGKRGERFIEIYRERCQLAELILTNTSRPLSNGVEVHVSHFPYADSELSGLENRHGKVIVDKFAPWRVVDDGSWLLSCPRVLEAARPDDQCGRGCLGWSSGERGRDHRSDQCRSAESGGSAMGFRPMNLRRTARTAVDLGAMLDEDRGRLDVDLSRSRLA